MNRYRMTAYYEDHTTAARVAQEVVVIGKDVRSAVDAVSSKLCPRAIGRHIIAIDITEGRAVASGVVHIGEPYIPIHWPLVNRPRQTPAGARPQAAPLPPDEPEAQPSTGVFGGPPQRAEFSSPVGAAVTSVAG